MHMSQTELELVLETYDAINLKQRRMYLDTGMSQYTSRYAFQCNDG